MSLLHLKVVSRTACRVGPGFEPGSGLKLVKLFWADFGPAYTSFLYHSNNDFFLSRSTFVLLTVVTSVSEVTMTFLQLVIFANTAAFFCSLLGLVSHSF